MTCPISCAEDRGAITAEFVMVVPALLLVVMIVFGALTYATQRMVLTSAAHDISRLEARGDSSAASQRLNALPNQVNVERSRRGWLLCVSLRSNSVAGVLGVLTPHATGCAATSEAGGPAAPQAPGVS